MKSTLKFFWNGIKDSTGKLHTVSYSDGQLINYPAGTITIYKKEYARFPKEVTDAFIVENESDSQSDYFDTDKIRVIPTHRLYAQVATAMAAHQAHYRKLWEKRQARRYEDPTGHCHVCYSDADPGL